jgi:uncharacterized coiled-coil protein SlyX
MANADEMGELRRRVEQLEELVALQAVTNETMNTLIKGVQENQTKNFGQMKDLFMGLHDALGKLHKQVSPESDGTDLGLPELKLIDPEAGQRR